MENGLVKTERSLAVTKVGEIDELLKPMVRDILLFVTKIGETYRLKDKKPLFDLKKGQELSFKLSDSKYEDERILINDGEGRLTGYVPEPDTPVFARLMDAGKKLFAIVKSISMTHSVPLIEIEIYLRDY